MNAIGWCDVTWSPVTGCKPDYPCWERCWARRMANRLKGRYGYSRDNSFAPTFHPDKFDEPLRWKKPRTIFVCRMGDLYAEGGDIDWQDDVIDRIYQADWHTFILLSKRVSEMNTHLRGVWAALGGYPGNLVIGTSVSNQAEWDARVPLLCQIPAWRRVVSVEPCLGPIDMAEWLAPQGKGRSSDGHEVVLSGPIHGIVCGCETGPDARAMELDWARNLRDQCAAAGVAFFLKKTSPFKTIGGDVNRTLDGRTHNELCWTKETP